MDTSGLTHRMAFYQGATLALKLGAPIQVRLDPILHYWVGLTFPVMELPKHVEKSSIVGLICQRTTMFNYTKLVAAGGNAPPPWTSKDQALLLCKAAIQSEG